MASGLLDIIDVPLRKVGNTDGGERGDGVVTPAEYKSGLAPKAYRPACAPPRWGLHWRVELRHACFGVVTDDRGLVLFAAPIGAGWLMKTIADLRAYYAERGDLVSLVEVNAVL